MGEKENSGKNSHPAFLLMQKISLTVLVLGFYSQTPLQFTKNPKLKAIIRDKFGRIPKRENRSQNVKNQDGK